jgi:hypothetical protein
MKFCPVFPEICRGQVHGHRKERRKKRKKKRKRRKRKRKRIIIMIIIVINTSSCWISKAGVSMVYLQYQGCQSVDLSVIFFI